MAPTYMVQEVGSLRGYGWCRRLKVITPVPRGGISYYLVNKKHTELNGEQLDSKKGIDMLKEKYDRAKQLGCCWAGSGCINRSLN